MTDKTDKKKILNIVFVAVTALILIVPLCLSNFRTNQVSDIDNKALTEWPQVMVPNQETFTTLSDYFSDRIGFREQAIEFYTEFNDKLFGVMVHPLFMYGQDGHIFYKDPDYIAAYQHLNTDPEYLDSFVRFLSQTNDYLHEKGIEFLYFVCPDKKTIYSEYFPKTVNVSPTDISVLDYLDARMADTDIKYINPKDELLLAKQNAVVYNKMYDATHWNDLGAFVGHSLIDEYIAEKFDDVKRLDVNDYSLGYVNMDSLDIARFPISEDVPLYTLNEDLSGDYTELLKTSLNCNTTTFYTHHINESVPNNRILLVFTDSYFQAHQKFYDNRFREVYFVHRQNSDYVQYFVNLCFPDMVIFETAERSISSEMPLNTDFTDYYYEKPYPGTNEIVEAADKSAGELTYTVRATSGCTVEGSDIVLDPNDGAAIARVDCILNSSENGRYDVYTSTADEIMETGYNALHKESIEAGAELFSFSIQRRYMAQGVIHLFAYDNVTGETILLEDFGVRYNE